jgi:mono/diheme cytochrome c family protein
MIYWAERLGRSCFLFCVSTLAVCASADQHIHAENPQISNGAQVFSKSCLPCHGANSPAALDLTDPISLRRRATTAAQVVRDGLMPPWLPSESGALLKHSRKLSATDRASLLEWLDQSAQGKVPSAVVTPRPSQESEIAFRVADGLQVGGDPGMTLRSFAIKQDPTMNPDTPKFFNAIEFVADAPGVVHSVSFLWDELGYAARLDASDPAPGYDAVGDIGLQVSGSSGCVSRLSTLWQLPKGYTMKIPIDAVLVAEVHAEGRGKMESTAGNVCFLAPEFPCKLVHAIAISPSRPATITSACEAVSISIRAGSRVQSIDVFAKDAKGQLQCVLNIPKWNERLSEPWMFDPPLALGAGTELIVQSTVNADAQKTPLDAHAAAMSQPMIVVLVADNDADLIREK